MSFNEVVQYVIDYMRTNIKGGIASAIILLFLILKRPRLFFALLILAAIAIGISSLFDKISLFLGNHSVFKN